MRISDWSSDVCSSDLWGLPFSAPICGAKLVLPADKMDGKDLHELIEAEGVTFTCGVPTIWTMYLAHLERRSEEHTSELQSLMRISYAVFCLKKKKPTNQIRIDNIP